MDVRLKQGAELSKKNVISILKTSGHAMHHDFVSNYFHSTLLSSDIVGLKAVQTKNTKWNYWNDRLVILQRNTKNSKYLMFTKYIATLLLSPWYFTQHATPHFGILATLAT